MNMGTVAGLLSLVIVAGAGRADAQTIERVRELYIAAAYEEALAALPPGASDSSPAVPAEVEEYRALCLLALGRTDEATAAIERLVRSAPTFVPSADSSPRMRVLVEEVRAKRVPELARQTYADAKAAFDAKEVSSARAGFTRALEIIDSLPESGRGTLSDLRLLAAGFLELSGNPEPVAPLASAPGAPSDKPEPPRSAVAVYTPPLALREELPVWVPPDSIALHTEYTGLLEIDIGADGRVLETRVVKPSHPVYDAAVIRAAKQWTYKPATRNGQPVASLKSIQVRLVPR